jgi:hypothetical protein
MNKSEQRWQEAILPTGSSNWQAAQVLNDSSLKIGLVDDTNEGLVRKISVGDIRRGLMKGLELTSTIDPIVQEDTLVVPPVLVATWISN